MITQDDRQAPSVGAWTWFASWAGVGAIFTLGFVSILTIGIVLLSVGVLAALVLVKFGRNSSVELMGLISGSAAPIAYIAWLNREGPGNVCTSVRGGIECTEEWNPVPFWTVSALLFITGVVLFVVLRKRAQRR